MTDFSKHTTADIEKEIAEKRGALKSFRFGEAGSRARNVREGRNLRKDIARLMTELSSRRVAQKAKNA